MTLRKKGFLFVGAVSNPYTQVKVNLIRAAGGQVLMQRLWGTCQRFQMQMVVELKLFVAIALDTWVMFSRVKILPQKTQDIV